MKTYKISENELDERLELDKRKNHRAFCVCSQTLEEAPDGFYDLQRNNLHIARTYLTATDPEVAKRTWQVPMDEMTKAKTGPTRARHVVAMKDKAFDIIRNLPILETHAAHFLKVLELGSVSTNVYLRRIHNFALDMNWLA